ncbi:MAG: PEP-CTERM sorting domain-containing protein [Cephaloticoccus sp.]|nr:PEP-CTERM sorting domain-containing protein [Cephaloticoccus sp.]
MKKALVIALSLLAGTCAWAQVTITFNGTVNTVNDTSGPTTLGYAVSDPITLTFVLNDAVTPNVTGYNWYEDTLGDPLIFSAVSGTGVSGTFDRSTGVDANVQLQVTAPSQLSLQFLYTAPVGLTVNSQSIVNITASATYDGLTFDTSGSAPTPTEYFSAYVGSYNANWTSGSTGVYSYNFGPSVYVTINSMTISSVPEPSTYAALAGMLVLGLTCWRRRLV